MLRFKIVINCGPCEDFIGKCLESVKDQSYSDFEACVTTDPCGDDTPRRARLAAGDDPRFRIHQNRVRQYSLHNMVRAIGDSQVDSEDVIVNLDGDDWFSDRHALRIISDTYGEFDCWLTYGSWLSNVLGLSGRRDGLWPAYPEGTTDFRSHRFLGTAVRTCKKWLWDCLKDSDLRDDSGEYFRVSEDQMIMIPMLEMCGTAKARHIAAPLMTYNKLVKYAEDKGIAAERERNGRLICSRPPYPRLMRKIQTPVSVN
jgi:glycosyltransferase involved in cell wall biosynthesis